MKERPIIFSGPMVRAILDGRKTQTRRVVKCIYKIKRIATPSEWNLGRAHPNMRLYEEWGAKNGCGLFESECGTKFAMPCPYGVPGDRLWVRETFSAEPPYVWYRADSEEPLYPDGQFYEGKWKPSIHMPRWASRIFLEIKNVRAEWLQDISEEDAKAEGPTQHPNYPKDYYCSWVTAFEKLWDSINGKKHPWISNPFVWVIKFERIKP